VSVGFPLLLIALGHLDNTNEWLQAILPAVTGLPEILGYYWYLRLRAYEIDQVDFARKSLGNTYTLGKQTNERGNWQNS
jgi:hypothetical protein